MVAVTAVGALQRKHSSATQAAIERKLEEAETKKNEPIKPYKNPDNYSSDFAKRYIAFAYQCERLVESDSFNFWIIIVIIIAGILVGLQTYSAFETDAVIETLDSIILGVFVFELLLKVFAEACAPWVFFTGPERAWNIFDFLIVILSLPFWGSTFGGNSIKLLRLTRLMRVMKLLKKIPQLQMIVMGLVGGLKSIIYILALLALVFYIYAIIGVTLFHENDPFHFRSVPVSVVTLFRMATLEDWTDILYLNYYGCDSDTYDTTYLAFAYPHGCKQGMKDELLNMRGFTVIYFVSFVVIASMVMLSLFVGAVTMSMTESMTAMKLESELSERKRRLAKAKKRAEREKESRRALKKGSHKLSQLDSVQEKSPENVSEGSTLKDALSNSVLSSTKDVGEKKNFGDMLKNAATKSAQEESQHRKSSLIQFNDEQKDKVQGVLNVFGSKKKRIGSVLPMDQVGKTGADRFKNLAAKALKTIHNGRRSSIIWNPFSTANVPREEQERVRAAFKGAWEGVDLLDLLDDHVELEYDMYFKKKWARLSYVSNSIINNAYFQNFIVFVILIASILVGLQTEQQVQETSGNNAVWDMVLSLLDWIVLSIFIFEILLKAIAERFHPWRYFIRYGQVQGWNIFDYVVVTVSLIPGGSLNMFNMLRLLRLLRVFKLVKSLPALQVIIVALIGGLTSISYIGIILFLVFYVFSIMGMILFQESDPWHFGSLHISLFTLFRMATLEDWSDVLYISMYGCNRYGYSGNEGVCTTPIAYGPVAALFFVSFVLLGALVLMTLFIGVVTTSMEQATRKQESDREFAEKLDDLKVKYGISEKTMRVYQKLFDLLDLDGSGTIEEEELKLGLESIGKCPEPAELSRMVKLVDEDGSGEIDLIEFVILLSVISKYNGGSVMYQPDFRIRKSLLIKQRSNKVVDEESAN